MNTPAEIRALAKERLDEAVILAGAGKYDGAFYLAGYAIELALKAKISENFGFPNLFADGDSSDATRGLGELRRAVRTHDLLALLLFSGLRQKFNEAKAREIQLLRINSLLVAVWNENYRYKPPGFSRTQEVEEIISLLTGPNNVIEWISKN